jgi:uroporphyrinogen decarboxylase
MTPRDRAIIALTRQPPPPELVPTFELEFQLTQELLGKEFHEGAAWQNVGPRERERMLCENAALYIEVAERLDYSIIMVTRGAPDEAGLSEIARAIRRLCGDRYLVICHGDGTYAIPNGNDMEEQAAAFFERPDEMKRSADRMVDLALERGQRLLEAGYDGFALCADYCFNSGPFLSPRMFAQFVTPYLARLVAGYREMGAYVIKHTDGNIMPILDQLVSCRPHAIHSLDGQARDMDLAEIKRRVGDRVCLIGGVQCSLLQTGTEEQIIENCRYTLQHGMPGGGYIYSTTNVAFKGLRLERYLLILQVREQYGRYVEQIQND